MLKELVYLLLPMGLANMAPTFFRPAARPINHKIFGNHKTWRGIFVAILFGGLMGIILFFIKPLFPWWFGFILGAGAILGDLIKSFFKRCFNIAPGQRWFPFDQLDWVIGGLLAAEIFWPVSWQVWLILLLLGIILHLLTCHIGFWLKVKPTPW